MTSDDSSAPCAPRAWRQTLAAKRSLARYAGWLASASLVLVAAVLVAGLAWLWSGMRDSTAHLADLEERLARLAAQEGGSDTDVAVMRLAQRLDAAQAALAAEAGYRAGLETDFAELVQRMDRLEEGLNDANGDLQHPDVADRERTSLIDMLHREMASLRERLDTLAARSGDHGAAFVIAVGQLRETVDSGLPFVAELEAVVVLEADDPEIAADLDTLARHAGGGVATHHALEASLGHVLTAAGNASRVAAASGWVDETLAHIESLVTVRRIGDEFAGTGNQAAIRRIETAVAAGNLEEALREIESLPLEFSRSMAQWAARARTRIEADNALDRLHARAISGVTQP